MNRAGGMTTMRNESYVVPIASRCFPVDLNSYPGHSPISACSMKAKNRTALTYLILQIILFALRKEVIAYVIPLLYLEYPLL